MAHDVGPIGGMERQLTELITGLLRRGHDLTVISRRCDLPAHPALRWIRVPGPRRPFALAYPWFLLVGTLLVWRHRVGLLHTTGAIVLNRADLCTVHYCHHGARGKTKSSWSNLGVLRRASGRVSAALAQLTEGWIYCSELARHFIAVSEGVALELRQHFPALTPDITVIPNAIDEGVFQPDLPSRTQVRAAYGLSQSDFVVLFVGGDWHRKGLDLGIQSVAPIEGCHLMVVGSGDVDRYRRMARNLACDGRVHFVGARTDVARYYAAADVFLLPTLYEACSLAINEAAAAGLPLLLTRVNGAELVLSDGENGWFIEREPGMITSRLRDLARDENLRKLMGAKSRQAIASYSWPRTVSDYLTIYRQLTPSAPPRVVDSALASIGR